MKLGVLADCFKLPIEESIKTAASLGLDGVQIYATTGEFSPEVLTSERKAEIKDLTERLEGRKADLAQKKEELDQIIADTKQDEERLRDKAKKLEAIIEPRLLTAFKRIRKGARNGLAVVAVQRGACGGCFNKIPPQKQLDIKLRKKIIVCEYCGRIMIDPELAGLDD